MKLWSNGDERQGNRERGKQEWKRDDEEREKGKEKESRKEMSKHTIQIQGSLHLQRISVDDSDGVFSFTQRVVVKFALNVR